jgi:hypothetical protein
LRRQSRAIVARGFDSGRRSLSAPSSISRADLADFLVEACESTIWVGKAVQLGG